MRRALLALALLVFPLAAHADDPLATVRGLVEAGDTAGLERALADLDRAGNPAALRAVNATLFETTHPDRIAVLQRWAEERPGSPYAATAVAWAALKELEMWSDPERPSERYAMAPTPQTAERYKAARTAAQAAGARAMEVSEGDYVPALDAWMRGHEIAADWDGFGPVAEALLALAPDPDTAQIIVHAAVAQSSSEAEQAVGACLQLGDLIEGYDADTCVIEAVANQYLGDELEDMVFDLVEAQDDPRFDAIRLRAMLDYARRDPAEAEAWVALHRKILGPDTDLTEYNRQAITIARFGDRRAYLDEAVTRIVAALDDRLADDPFNRNYLQLKAEVLLGRYTDAGADADLAAARAAWEGLIRYAADQGDTWMLGAELARADRDPSDILVAEVFWENAIGYSRQDPGQILGWFYFMNLAREAAEARLAAGDTAAPDPGVTLEALKCPMLRAARTASALCQTPGMGFDVCDPEKPYFAPVPGVLEAGKAGSCPAVAAAPLSELSYKVSPADEIALPW